MTRYVALLRGINVGGKNIIRMNDLRDCFGGLGFTDVATYIQSGNVLFSSEADPEFVERIEMTLGARFGYKASVVIRSQKQMRSVVSRAPDGFGSEPAKYRYDVLFLKEPLTSAAAIKVVPLKEGVDAVSIGPGVLYFSRLISKAAQSRLNKVVSMPIYKSMTIRNWNTTTALQRMMEEG